MNSIHKIIVIISLSFGVEANVTDSNYGELQTYEKLNPHIEFKKAIEDEDLRFIALMGFALYMPGADDYYEKYSSYGYKKIKGTSDLIRGYEHGRLTEIARYYARTYNSILKRYIVEIDGWKMTKTLNGYKQLLSSYTVESVNKGHINSLPYSLKTDLLSNDNRCVMRAWWFNPIAKEVLKYDWLDFEGINAEIDQAVCMHTWIGDWLRAGNDRTAESQIFGLRPSTETDIDLYVGAPWKAAGLKSEPYYEVLLREGDTMVGTLFIGKNKENAIIISTDTTGNTHWLDQFEFSYHPRAEKLEYIIVTKEGQWKKK
jgi:hypothetical protein